MQAVEQRLGELHAAGRWSRAWRGDTRDAVGNPLSNQGNRGTGSNAAGFSKIQKIPDYVYDTLHRLTQADYDLGGGVTKAEAFDYDELGNRVEYRDNRNSVTTAYENNVVNEVTQIGGLVAAYDAAGNLSRRPYDISGGTTRYYEYGYDHDNRLTAIDFDDGTNVLAVARYEYDALGRLISSQMRYDSDTNADTSTTKYYYDGQNAVAEYDESDTLQRRYVHGTTYIDERAVLIEGAAGQADAFYYLLENLYTVTGLIKNNGTLAEANVYDAYGFVTIWAYSDGDFDRDGDVDTTDQTTFSAILSGGGFGLNPTPDPTGDFDMDGDTDATDSSTFTTIKNGGGPVTEIYTSGLGNTFFFTGRRLFHYEAAAEVTPSLDPQANQQIQYNRARFYDPVDGRWLQRDPWGYLDGAHLYQMVRSRPSFALDPFGLRTAPKCVVVLALSHEDAVKQFEGESECSAWGHIACFADDFNYEVCKDEKGKPVIDPKTGEPKLCEKPGSIPGLPHIDEPIGPRKGHRDWTKTMQAFLEAARNQAEALSKDCKCKCKRIVVQLICEWDPKEEVGMSLGQYEQRPEGKWYKRYCGRKNFEILEDGCFKNTPNEAWRGWSKTFECKKNSKGCR